MIEAYTGLPGAGKTYNMVRRAYAKHLQGKKIYANFKTTFATYYKELDEIFGIQDAIVLIDEAGIYLPAQAWNKIPFEFMRSIRQHRKNGLDMYYTAQDLQDVATALRRVTQFQRDINRTWKFCFERTTNPRTKEKYGFEISILNKKIFDLYDTYDEVEFGSYMELGNNANTK